jgi:hypothetical protein
VSEQDNRLPVVSPPEPTGPAALLAAAIQKGVDAEGIKTLAEVYQKMEALRAEREFNDALAGFQAVCPVLKKRTAIEFPTRGGGVFRSQYAAMEDLIEDTRALRAQFGFSHSFEPSVTGTQITVVCVLRHRGGHQTRTPFSVPLPKDARLSEAHAVAGAVTFCERYAFCGALGLTTGRDRDGAELAGESAHISEEQRHQLEALFEEAKPDPARFWAYAGVPPGRLGELPAADFNKIQQALLAARSRRRK